MHRITLLNSRSCLFAALLSLLSLVLSSALSGQTTYPAENAVLAGGAVTETTNSGYLGSGYVNFSTTNGTATFNAVVGNGGTHTLTIRYALGTTNSRTGNLTVNGAVQSITFTPTGAWNTWTTRALDIPLNNSSTNVIQFSSTGQDLANIDQITVASAGTGTQVQRWQPYDFSFVSASTPSNPFTVTFTATATGPGGVTLTIPGFYDGSNTWKIRLSPTVVGAWSLKTSSSVADLNGKTASFSCVQNDPAFHGALKVDTSHPRNFLFEDGTRWYPMGYEADWLWALDLANASSTPVTGAFLDKIAASGFNFVLLNTYAHDTTWRAGTTAADDYGPPALYAWAGTNSSPDHTRMNVTYWKRYDRTLDALYRRGLIAHIYFKVTNKGVNWPANGSAEDDMFFRYVVARYAAYPNVTWDILKEAQHEASTSYKIGRVNFIRANDPYDRLITAHDDGAVYDAGTYNSVLSYRSEQEQSGIHAAELSDLAQKQWPVINVEFGYEWGPGGSADKTYSVVQSPKEVARRAWEICTTGAFCAYYYTYTAWDVVRPNDSPPGYGYFKNLRTFFEGTQYWLMNSSDNLVTSSGYCLANPGKEYIVFHNAATSFKLTISGAAGSLTAEWFEPYSGARVSAGTLTNGTPTLTPPSSLGTGPMALHVWTP